MSGFAEALHRSAQLEDSRRKQYQEAVSYAFQRHLRRLQPSNRLASKAIMSGEECGLGWGWTSRLTHRRRAT